MNKLQQAIIDGNQLLFEEEVEGALETKTDINEILEQISTALKVIGDKFRNKELFLPELMMAGYMVSNVVSKIEAERRVKAKPKASIVIGTVEGDVHDIGKSFVTMFLKSNGYEIIDLGVDVPPESFYKALVENDSPFLAVSALLSTTMQNIPKLIDYLSKKNIRDKVCVIVGGAALTAELARSFGADHYGENAPDAVKIVDKNIS